MFFSVQTKNLNWEILTKNLVTFKRWDGVKDEKFQFYRGSLKNLIFKEGVCEKPICMGELPKSGAWTVCRFKEGGGVAGKERGDFWGELIPQCIVCPFKHFQYFVSPYVCLPHCFLVLYMLDVHSKVPMKYPLYVIPFVHLSCVFLQNSLQKLPDFLHEFMVSSNLKGDGA